MNIVYLLYYNITSEGKLSIEGLIKKHTMFVGKDIMCGHLVLEDRFMINCYSNQGHRGQVVMKYSGDASGVIIMHNYLQYIFILVFLIATLAIGLCRKRPAQ